MRYGFILCVLMILAMAGFPAQSSAQDENNFVVTDPINDDTVDVLGTIIREQTGDFMPGSQGEDTPSTPAIMGDDDVVLPEGEVGEDIRLDPDFLSDDEGKNYDDYPSVTVRILDKITAESHSFDLAVGKTVKFGSIRIRPMTCKKAPPIEEPESVSFLQIWEQLPDGANEWIFSGWMFASSPSLSAMDHPVYDVWVLDCKE